MRLGHKSTLCTFTCVQKITEVNPSLQLSWPFIVSLITVFSVPSCPEYGPTLTMQVCAVSAPTGLAAFNVGGVTIHRLLQLPIEHEGRAAGYWKLGEDALKVMRASLSQLRLVIIDEISMVSSLNLAYIHLRLDEIFAKDEWFGGVKLCHQQTEYINLMYCLLVTYCSFHRSMVEQCLNVSATNP